MQAFYFGKSNSPLYGVLHYPRSEQLRSISVLLCHPLGHEYLRSYRMLRLLAIRLSELGYYVLRFDYRGTGDSAGDFEDSDLHGWSQDLVKAVDELQALSSTTNSTVIGVRAAALLILTCSEFSRFNRIVLWDPCLSGIEFLEQLNTVGTGILTSRAWFSLPRTPDVLLKNEYIGFCYSDACLGQLKDTDVSQVGYPRVKEYILLSTEKNAQLDQLNANLQSNGLKSELLYLEDMGQWNVIEKISLSITTNKIVTEICNRLA